MRRKREEGGLRRPSLMFVVSWGCKVATRGCVGVEGCITISSIHNTFNVAQADTIQTHNITLNSADHIAM